MPPRISLALAIHNHQPVGNFGWVIAEVFEQAYRPMVEALERHPRVRVSLHYSGPLIEWLRAEQPEFLGRLVGLVDRGQVELLGGGWCEPILASLPERDRIGQLTRMADELEALTGHRPQGAWLAERVWEPDLPTSLAAAGYRWTILDDQHFRAASIAEENLWGAYTTDDQASLLAVFGTEQRLRYEIPFGEVETVIDYLRENATDDGLRVGVMGDDGEKFGGWPTTWEHCWGDGRWIERFLDAIEANADWLTTVTPSEWLARVPPIGRAYIPTSSYAEMGEWALPPDEALVFSDLLHDAVEHGRPEARWLRGGFWRNFQVRYREINDLHKQMLRASAKVEAMRNGPGRAAALDHLYRGQSNDCYWHGLFGGIYISHMRLASHEHLIAAEDAADAEAGTSERAEVVDLDYDGIDDLFLSTEGQVVTIDQAEGGGIGSWDVRAARHALGAVMRRRWEVYHARLLAAVEADDGDETDAGDEANAGEDEVTSIHLIDTHKEPGLAELLHIDSHERRSGLVHLLDPATEPDAYASATADELGDFLDRPFEVVELGPRRVVLARTGSVETAHGRVGARVEKTVRLGGGRLDPSLELEVRVANAGGLPIEALLGIAFDVTMLGGGGNPAAFWDIGGERTAHDVARTAAPVGVLRSGNDYLGLTLTTTVEPAGGAWISPLETISKSESGFERVYQGSALLLNWPLHLEPGDDARFVVRNEITVDRDRASDEA